MQQFSSLVSSVDAFSQGYEGTEAHRRGTVVTGRSVFDCCCLLLLLLLLLLFLRYGCCFCCCCCCYCCCCCCYRSCC